MQVIRKRALYIRYDTIKLLEENTGTTFSNINSSIFSGWSPKAKEIKAKINKWDLIKVISFCIAKKTIKQKGYLRTAENILLTMQPTGFNWKNIQTPHTAQYKNKNQTSR